VKIFGKYGGKVSLIVKRYGKYGRKLFSDMENMEENCEMIWKICKKVSRIVIRCGKYGTKPS
jgi:hypothetical protein